MNKKILLGIAILEIGVVVLPQTVALFSGQHDWYDTIAAGNQVACTKCHADVYDEISQGASGTVNARHRLQTTDPGGCEACHMTTAFQSPSTRILNIGGGITADFHAAAAPACMDCHDDGVAQDARSIFVGPDEVHIPFVNESERSYLLVGANEACVGCHTHVRVNITWQKATTLGFNASESMLPGGNHTWVVDEFNATGVNITKTSG